MNSETPSGGSESSESAPTSRRPSVRRRLNPLFVEWLMGWPGNWTDCLPLALTDYERWAMASCRCARRLLSDCSGGDCTKGVNGD